MSGERKRPIRRRRVLQVIAALLVTWLVVDKVISVVAPPPQVGHWRSKQGQNAYLAAYADVLATLPEPTRTHDVQTDYGSVRVYEWAADPGVPKDRLPVVMLPGIRSGAPMWGTNLSHWIGQRTLYAMDAIGDAGLSTQSVPFDSFHDRADWVEQLLAKLDLDRVHVMGHSFGAATAASYALQHPARIASLTLLEPVLVLHGIPVSTYLWATVLLLPVPQTLKDRGLAEIGGVTIEEVQERTAMSVMIDAAAAQYIAPTLVPQTLTDEEWRSMTAAMPIRVDLAAEKSLAGGAEAAARASRLGVDPVTVWPRTTHSLPMQAAEPLGRVLASYWAGHDR